VVAAAHPELRRIVTVVPDTGQRYFSSGLFGEPPAGEIPEREHRFDPHTAAQLRRHRDRLELLGGRASQPLPA
jgi:hypothetical protein